MRSWIPISIVIVLVVTALAIDRCGEAGVIAEQLVSERTLGSAHGGEGFGGTGGGPDARFGRCVVP